jgi:hypothetical protein
MITILPFTTPIKVERVRLVAPALHFRLLLRQNGKQCASENEGNRIGFFSR